MPTQIQPLKLVAALLTMFGVIFLVFVLVLSAVAIDQAMNPPPKIHISSLHLSLRPPESSVSAGATTGEWNIGFLVDKKPKKSPNVTRELLDLHIRVVYKNKVLSEAYVSPFELRRDMLVSSAVSTLFPAEVAAEFLSGDQGRVELWVKLVAKEEFLVRGGGGRRWEYECRRIGLGFTANGTVVAGNLVGGGVLCHRLTVLAFYEYRERQKQVGLINYTNSSF